MQSTIQASTLSSEDKKAALASLRLKIDSDEYLVVYKALLESLTNVLLSRAVSQEIITDLILISAYQISNLGIQSINPGVTPGQKVESIEMAYAIQLLKDDELPEELILFSLMNTLYPEDSYTPDDLKQITTASSLAVMTDVGLQSAAQTLLADYLGSNAPPEWVETEESQTLNPETGVTSVTLSLATDREAVFLGHALRYIVTEDPKFGTLSSFPKSATLGGHVEYRPSSNEKKQDSFSYQVCDRHSIRACTSIKKVTIGEEQKIEPPVAVKIPTLSKITNQTTTEDTPLEIKIDVLNLSGQQECNKILTGTSNNADLVASREIIFSGKTPQCKTNLLPLAHAFGTAEIKISLNQEDAKSEQSFTLDVQSINDSPSILLQGETEKSAMIGVLTSISLATATDPDALTNDQTLSYVVDEPPLVGTLGEFPSAGLSGNSVTYIYSNKMAQTDRFSYKICDSAPTPLCTDSTLVTLSLLKDFSAPSDLLLSNNTLAENSPPYTAIGSLVSVDADLNETFTYLLVAGEGDTDNALFEIDGDQLLFTTIANFESEQTYNIRIRTNDKDDQFFEKTFVIQITDVNEAPTDIMLSSTTVPENGGNNRIVGSLSTNDPDAANTITYSMYSSADGADNSFFTITGSNLILKNSANFEFRNSFSISVQATDQGGLSTSKAFTIAVSDVNEPPTMIELSNTSIASNSGANSIIGELSATDPDAGDTVSFELASGTGGTDNSQFEIIGNQLRILANPLALVKSFYSIRIAARDGAGAKLDNTFTIAVTKTGWYQEAYIKGSSGDSGDKFGTAIAMSGDTLVVSAPYEDSMSNQIINGTGSSNDSTGFMTGAVYIYRRSGSTWAQEAYIKAQNVSHWFQFGISIGLSADTLVVGSRGDWSGSNLITNGTSATPAYSVNSASSYGSVFVYKRNGNLWNQEAYIKASNAEIDDEFGTSVSISGNSLAVGARHEDSAATTVTNGTGASADNTASNAGAVYLFSRTGSTWAPEAYLKAANAGANDNYGESVSLFGDTLAVGAPFEDSNVTGISNGTSAPINDLAPEYAGAVYVYRRTNGIWTQEAFFKANPVLSNDTFGAKVALSGNLLLVGVRHDANDLKGVVNGNGTSNFFTSSGDAWGSGAAYLYTRNGTTWQPNAYFKAPNGEFQDFLGDSIAISGNTIALGATEEDSAQTTVTNNTGASGDNNASNSGAVYVYTRQGTGNWQQEAYVKASNANQGDRFGSSVALSGNTLVVGAVGEQSSQTQITNGSTSSTDNSQTDTGAVYVYRNFERLFDPDIRVLSISSSSISFSWGADLGPGNPQVIVAPVALGTASPSACQLNGAGNSLTLPASTTSYVYSDLLPNTKYGFRFCSTDGVRISLGHTIWLTTAAP